MLLAACGVWLNLSVSTLTILSPSTSNTAIVTLSFTFTSLFVLMIIICNERLSALIVVVTLFAGRYSLFPGYETVTFVSFVSGVYSSEYLPSSSVVTF